MKALVTAAGEDAGLRLDSVAEPVPLPGQALVEVAAVAVNRGELSVIGQLPPGSRLGWDVAGTVVAAAADGSGPPAGTRVLGLADRDGWAERVALDTGRLAVLPDSLEWAAAAALPVAGLTALYALRRAGTLLGRTVLVTGAAGGVGRAAVQLAAQAGARVIAWVGSPARTEGLHLLGADVIDLYGAGGTEPVDVLLDSCGGEVLTQGFQAVAPGGTVVCFGNTARAELRLPVDWGRARPGVSLHYLFLFDEITRRDVGRDLATLVRLADGQQLDPQVALVADWTDPAPAFARLQDRQVNGKLVLAL
ncbi:zinc-binding dehydrogenase [Actinacidiphila epipremni]|uniref:Zinc-binding dehydrogenase n=1 Tax=Actinacidiphila epipremni TaxID=2053013 RepID=A0ABX0ZWW6_9ACTN|nr:zinc-binding dehydrogenase [Actinacidiphila epipremni]NJP46063.1 zinc-binding dehydrogenase [Actinacidiphila epipremni]